MTPEEQIKQLMAHRATLDKQLQKQRARARETSQFDLRLLGFKVDDSGLLSRFWTLFLISFLGLLFIGGLILLVV